VRVEHVRNRKFLTNPWSAPSNDEQVSGCLEWLVCGGGGGGGEGKSGGEDH